VMFGGSTTGSLTRVVADTWVWDGANWTQKFPATSAQARFGGAFAYDEVRDLGVLYSGYVTDRATWTWDGSTWTMALPETATNPLAAGPVMVYDSFHAQVVLFGGVKLDAQYNNYLSNETWIWGGN